MVLVFVRSNDSILSYMTSILSIPFILFILYLIAQNLSSIFGSSYNFTKSLVNFGPYANFKYILVGFSFVSTMYFIEKNLKFSFLSIFEDQFCVLEWHFQLDKLLHFKVLFLLFSKTSSRPTFWIICFLALVLLFFS